MNIISKFNKKGFKGFTLIELLVVIAIIGLLSSIIASPIQNARKKAKDTKKIAELNATQLALEQYAEANGGNYPPTLAALAGQYMPILPVYAGVGAPGRDRFAYVTYSASPVGSTVMQVFGYHMAIKLDVYNVVLDTDRDCTGVTAGTNIVAPACAFFNTTNPITINYSNYDATAGMLGGAGVGAATDILLTNDGATTTCTGINDCVYDVTSQQ